MKINFELIESASCISITKGSWCPRNIYKYNDRLFIKIGSSFIPMESNGNEIFAGKYRIVDIEGIDFAKDYPTMNCVSCPKNLVNALDKVVISRERSNYTLGRAEQNSKSNKLLDFKNKLIQNVSDSLEHIIDNQGSVRYYNIPEIVKDLKNIEV